MEDKCRMAALAAKSLNMSLQDIYLQLYNRSALQDCDLRETQTQDPACVTIELGSPAVVFSERVCVFTSLALVVIGLVGNFFSLLVFSSKEMRIVSSNVYLLLLACSDSFFLISVLLTKILTILRCLYFVESLMDFFNRSVACCKILQYLLDLCSDYSTCLIMAFTVERFVAVYMPIKFKEICTVRRARIACTVILVVIAVLIAPYHYMYIDLHPGFQVCTIRQDKEQLFSHIYVAEMTVFRIIPVFIVAVLNCLIIAKLWNMMMDKRKRKSTRTPLVPTSGSGKHSRKNSRGRNKEDKNLQITIMLILVSTSYILVFLPVLIFFIIQKMERALFFVIPVRSMWMAESYTDTLYILGFAINFFLYTVSGKVFREQLVAILCDRKPRNKQLKNGPNGHTYVTHCAEATTLV